MNHSQLIKIDNYSNITIELNHRQLINIENYVDMTKDQSLLESNKCVNKVKSLGIKLMCIRLCECSW